MAAALAPAEAGAPRRACVPAAEPEFAGEARDGAYPGEACADSAAAWAAPAGAPQERGDPQEEDVQG